MSTAKTYSIKLGWFLCRFTVIKWFKVILMCLLRWPKPKGKDKDKKSEARFSSISKPWTNWKNCKYVKNKQSITSNLTWPKISKKKLNALRTLAKRWSFSNKRNSKPSSVKIMKLQSSSTIKWKKWETKINGGHRRVTSRREILLNFIKNTKRKTHTKSKTSLNQFLPCLINSNDQSQCNKKDRWW